MTAMSMTLDTGATIKYDEYRDKYDSNHNFVIIVI
jgi:hypothetical protein